MDRDTLAIAQKTFHKISTMYPALQMRVHNDDPVELSMDIPQQLGLKYKINLNLQNTDELHISAGNFWLEWFPCTDSVKSRSIY
jgi:hypothetical protein